MAGKVWVLETSTKGTGANMVPLERVLRSPASTPTATPAPLYVPPKRAPAPAPEVEPRAPRRFRIVDVVSRAALGYDIGAREAVELLGAIRSVVDVNVYVWEPGRERWRLLTTAEQGAMWELRARG
ncbi:MAG TPA: hypothetical protein VG388_05950 [Solirubrobacteraceae bacterium]|nr:hypothetical protein [Solirubrobacteraceae bacterium]